MERELNEDRQNLLGNQPTYLVQLVAEAVAEPAKTVRLQRTHAARAALIGATANLVGRKTAAGTVRANLFELSRDGQSMELAPGGFAGRGIRSVGKFEAGDRTFDLAMVEQSQFIRSVKEELAWRRYARRRSMLAQPDRRNLGADRPAHSAAAH